MVEEVEAVQRTDAEHDNSRFETEAEISDDIRHRLEETIRYYARYPDQIGLRLEELDREWDLDQMLQAHLSALSLIGLVMGGIGRKGWFLLPVVACSFMLQHVLKGWSPPVELLRRFGVRSKQEIMREHYALRALRGDFYPLCESQGVELGKRVEVVLQTFVW